MKTVRLMGHAGSDIEVGYKSLNEIESTEFNDPLLHTARIMIDNKLLDKDDIVRIYEKVVTEFLKFLIKLQPAQSYLKVRK